MRKYTFLLSFVVMCSVVSAQNKSYTFVFLNNKPDKEVLSKEKSDSIMQGHMNNIGRLAKEGKLLAAGPFEGGGGIFILNTTSVDEANQWLATDPGVKAKRWNLEALPYTVKTGSVCTVGEKYEMVFYQFIRFMPTGKETDLSSTEGLVKKMHEQGMIIHEGIFGDKQGSILILKADTVKEVIDPSTEVMKKLYIAKGSFCEK